MPRPVVASKGARLATHHHHAFHALGRRVSHVPSIVRRTDGCPKIGNPFRPERIARAAARVVGAPILTTVGIAVVGVSAFPRSAVVHLFDDPSGTGPAGGFPVLQPPGAAPGGPPSTVISVPEPGTAAILALAMIVVLISSWFHGGRAFRKTPESEIVAAPRKQRTGQILGIANQGEMDMGD